ncbi:MULTISPECIES: hypothetical protein [Spirulina sp. CCY15215]|uniref:hypothetical protein n=1 Tax=Spirulina sp. CCY15215 TaxID=2767591 RepID=UPI00194E83EB|nr:hypothetical protein [Spirulina major]
MLVKTKFKQIFLSFCFAILLFLNTGCVAIERIDDETVLLKFPVMNEDIFPFNGKIFPLFKKDEESSVSDQSEVIDKVIEENGSEEASTSEIIELEFSQEQEEKIAPDIEPVEEAIETIEETVTSENEEEIASEIEPVEETVASENEEESSIPIISAEEQEEEVSSDIEPVEEAIETIEETVTSENEEEIASDIEPVEETVVSENEEESSIPMISAEEQEEEIASDIEPVEETVASENEEESSIPMISAEEQEEEIASDIEPIEDAIAVPKTEKDFTLILFPKSDRQESVILNQETYKKILRILRTSE